MPQKRFQPGGFFRREGEEVLGITEIVRVAKELPGLRLVAAVAPAAGAKGWNVVPTTAADG